MGLGCSDESRQKYGKWCALLDWIVGTERWPRIAGQVGGGNKVDSRL